MWNWLISLEWYEKAIGTILVTLILFFGFWLHCVNHVHMNEIGVTYDMISGDLARQDQPGFYVTSPFVEVSYLSMLPFKVTIPSNAKVINTKIVQFNLDGLDEYLRIQGWGYNLDQNMDNAFLGYAFSGQSFPFLTIVQTPGQETPGKLRHINGMSPVESN